MNGLAKPSTCKTIDDFEEAVAIEAKRLQTTSRSYESYADDEKIAEDVRGLVRVAVGKSSLLVSEKFAQFRKLCRQAREESDQTNASVALKPTRQDLEGFWDLVRYQIDDVDAKFNEIEAIRRNDWKMTSVTSVPASPRSRTREPSQSTRVSSLPPPKSEKSRLRDEERKKLLAAKKAEAKKKGLAFGGKGKSSDFVEIYVGSPVQKPKEIKF